MRRPNFYWPKVSLKQVLFLIAASLPIIAYTFKFSLLYRHGIFMGEDWDYFAQSYEAARQSVLHYHQFPWWNPWMNGGQPLFANPQFGLFSLQMPLVLLFGTVAGLHYSILIYYLLGFWGMYLLLNRLGSNSSLLSVLLAYIWVFSSFNAWHLAGGHFSFNVYLLAPWLFLTLLNVHKRRGWLWFGLVASLMIQSAAHYLTVEALTICGFIVVYQLVRYYRTNTFRATQVLKVLRPYLLALLVTALLGGFRLIYSLQFTHEFPRFVPLDPPESLKLFIASITFRHAVDPATLTFQGVTHYGWAEYADYFGLLTIMLTCYLIIKKFEAVKKVSFRDWSILGATILALGLTFGGFLGFSPFSLLHHLPVYNQMRVPSRFICWFVFGVILLLVRLPKKPIIYVILVFSVIDVFVASYPILNYSQRPYTERTNFSRSFEQAEFYGTSPKLGLLGILNLQDLRLLRATQNNTGEVYGYEPVLDVAEYYFLPGTNRCGVKQGCGFVLTHNAKVIKWSPQDIWLQRTGPGPIELNMNPGKVWRVNGQKIFPNQRLLELKNDFVINNSAKEITVKFSPALR